MNLIISWGYEINGEPFKRLLKELNVEYCAYMTGDVTHKPFESNIIHEPIFLYENYEYYVDKIKNAIPLDAELLNRLQPFETTAMDIIYRWRRSISTKNDFKEIKNIYYTFVRYWNDFILNRRINCLILFNLPHTPSNYIIYALCKAYDIPVVVQVKMANIEGALQNKYLTTDIDGMDPEFSERFIAYKKEYFNDKFINLADGYKQYFEEFGKENNDIKRVIIIESGMNLMEKVSLYINRAKLYISQQRFRILFKKIIYLIKTEFISRKILRYEEKLEEAPDLEGNFYFFPLQFQPEATSLPHAGRYVDQLLVIHMIAQSLPENVVLYVKEHPAFWKMKERYECVSEARSKDFYNNILAHPNVKLIQHDFSSLDLIDHCKCLVTCTGTASLEAVFKKKPAMVFGNMCYAFIPGVFKINSLDDCINAINEITRNNQKEYNPVELKLFFKALEDVSLTVGLTEGTVENEAESGQTISLATSADLTTTAIVKFLSRFYPKLL